MGHQQSSTVCEIESQLSFISGFPSGYAKMADETDLTQSITVMPITRVMKPPFYGIWSVYLASLPSPEPRVGHFSCVDEENQIAYIGYGTTGNNQLADDVWAFNMRTYQWRKLNITGDAVMPRNGSRALVVGRHLMIFGGFRDNIYLSGLHIIDIETGTAQNLVTSGEQPQPRSTPIMAYFDNKLFVWGGFNGQWINDLSILDLSTLIWRQKPTDIKGRTGAPFCQIGPKLYSYGGAEQEGVLILDCEIEEITIIPTTGQPPPYKPIGASMIRFDRYILYFGGSSRKTKYILIYAYDYEKNWWFVFHVLPDDETVSIVDGHVGDNGMFMIPQLYSFGACYSETRRAVVAYLGAPIQPRNEIFQLHIGEALGLLHLRDDMLDLL